MLPPCLHAQAIKGVVVDAETRIPLFPVNIMNTTTGINTSTDENGTFIIKAATGDKISLSFIGYATVQTTIAVTGEALHISLIPLSIQLKEYIVNPGLSAFQQDSLDLSNIYSKALDKNRTKPKFSTTGSGIAVNGLIGSYFEKHSRYYKRKKKFQENFQNDEQQKFIDTRYKPQLVTALTGYTGDTLAIFMNTYRMDYNFARTATDLELKMWIRSNFKEYMYKRD